MDCSGTSASVSGDRGVMSVTNGILLSLPLRLHGHTEQYNVFELLLDSSYDMKLGFLAISNSPEVDWSLCESTWYPFNFEMGLVRFAEAAANLA